jgi:hypothetical protein
MQRVPTSRKELNTHQNGRFSYSHCKTVSTESAPAPSIGQRLARLRQINIDNPVTHHDALEFPDGQVVLLTRLCVGQRATVLRLPAAVRPKTREEATLALRELSLSS